MRLRPKVKKLPPDSCSRQCTLATYCHRLVQREPSRHFRGGRARGLPPTRFYSYGDKAYDSSALRETATAKGVKTCIPGRTNRTTAVPFSAKLYRRRHRVENFFQKLKRYRRVATRYDKLGETFLGFVCLAILLTLRLT